MAELHTPEPQNLISDEQSAKAHKIKQGINLSHCFLYLFIVYLELTIINGYAKPPTKADLRRKLERDLASYLEAGNDVTAVPRGVSGKEAGENLAKPAHWQLEKSEGERTYLPDVVQRLDARKKPRAPTRAAAKKRPRKKLLYDDFGEPLRWVWIDE